ATGALLLPFRCCRTAQLDRQIWSTWCRSYLGNARHWPACAFLARRVAARAERRPRTPLVEHLRSEPARFASPSAGSPAPHAHPTEVLAMLIAVTGATGFLGRYLLRHLAGEGHRLRCWYRPASDRGGLDDVAHALEWLPGQLGDEAATGRLVRG